MIEFSERYKNNAGKYFFKLHGINGSRRGQTRFQYFEKGYHCKSYIIEKMLISVGSSLWCANAIYALKGININNLVIEVAKSEDPYLCYAVAQFLHNRYPGWFLDSIMVLEDGVIRSGNVDWCWSFFKNIDNQNRSKNLSKFILHNGGEYYLKAYGFL